MSSRVHVLALAAVLAFSVFLVSCAGSSGPAGAVTQSQQPSLASLQGRYALLNLSLIGSLNFDGRGSVNGEVQFFDPAPLGLVRVLVSGTYTVGPDGRGTTSLKAGAGSLRNPAFSFVVLANGDVLFTETDVQSSAAGIMKRQDPSSFSFAALNGTYSFGPLPMSGQLLCGPGALAIDQAGQVTITATPGGLFPDANFAAAGIDPVTGNVDVTQATGAADALYAVSSNEVFAQLDSFFGPVGCHVQRNTGGLSGATASQAYTLLMPAAFPFSAFLGDTGATFSVADGAVQSGTIDQLGFLDGGPVQQIDQLITSGAFSVNPDGSCALSLGANISATCFAVGPDFAFLQQLARTPDVPEAPVLIPGLITRRQASSFALNSLAGNFGVVVSGFRRDGAVISSVVRLTFDGNGMLSGLQDSNAGPGFVQNNVALHGTYTIAADGRGAMTLSSFAQTNHYVMYVASDSELYLLGLDGDHVTGFGRK